MSAIRKARKFMKQASYKNKKHQNQHETSLTWDEIGPLKNNVIKT